MSPTSLKQKKQHAPELKWTKSQGTTRKIRKVQSLASVDEWNGGGADEGFFLSHIFPVLIVFLWALVLFYISSSVLSFCLLLYYLHVPKSWVSVAGPHSVCYIVVYNAALVLYMCIPLCNRQLGTGYFSKLRK